MAKAILKTIEQNDNVGMFSICFDGSEVSEFEKFLNEFKDNATYNKDFNVILLALSKIIDKGALERFFRNEGRMNDNVKALAIDSRKLRLYCLRISDQITRKRRREEYSHLPGRQQTERLCDGFADF